MVSKNDLARLTRIAAEMRLNIINMMGAGKTHHFGGSLSVTDIVTALYFYAMKFDPMHTDWKDRDRFIMSKGHSVPAQYTALALLGVIPIEELSTLKILGTRLQGHPAMHLTPGVEGCTGALGEGLSYANGMALASRIQKSSIHIYCVLGDGELQEGQVWEAAMTTAKRRLSNVTAIIDRNRLKGMDETSSSKQMDPLPARWESFGWVVQEINGHNMAEICNALDWAIANTSTSVFPSVIIANTIKGKGVSFIEGRPEFHNSPINEAQFMLAKTELECALKNI